jgi:Flp pilus assembly protein TadG
MRTIFTRTRFGSTCPRAGVAAVECASVVPVLTLLVLGAIDMGQYANTFQLVNDASREGARVAVRHKTATTSEVQAAVIGYLKEAAPGTSSAKFASATQVTVTDALGSPIAGGDFAKLTTGSQINVQVTLQYGSVRWIGGFAGLDNKPIAVTTMMRRE